jgi:endo-1,4-beta-xylanase
MKRSTIQPDRPSFDFAAGDAVVDFAAAHQMKVRGHTLVWGRHNPLWLESAHDTPAELSA